MKPQHFFAPCPRGLEPVLADELRQFGARDIAPVDGGVGFTGDDVTMMRANLESRTASRVLLRLAHGRYLNERDVYQLAHQIDWPAWFSLDQTFKIKTDGVNAPVKSLDFVSLKIKDAICDRFRDATGARPSVDTRAPDIRVQAFLTRDSATIYLDTSGEPLFKRGWRGETGEAPLRENLAAGILLLAGYDGSQPLVDPMCGSGTFLVEAADIALKRAPGRNRRFGFEAFANFDAPQWQQVKKVVKNRELEPEPLMIWGSDRDRRMIETAERNLAQAGLKGLVRLKVQDALDARPPAPGGILIANPPYGVRLDEQDALAALYPSLGAWLKQYWAGWTAHFFTGDLRLAKLIRLNPKRRVPLYNGALECRLFAIPMVSGSNRKEKPGAGSPTPA